MLTSETKRHIDAARQVLVGVVPNPSSQIDQITNALIYKFMDDMDQSAIKAGGSPSFFIGDLGKYAWTRLMDSRLDNQERMNLYSEALIKFSEAKQLPELFRGIFKSAFLPYRLPEVLGLFLKEINYFDYFHPEDLGDGYEYLLSIMSSQGDAGQFRTPRHIIDFIVDAVNPSKNDKVLDPACGTGGFLVSSYKHILEQHDGKDEAGKANKEKPLTPDDRKKLFQNFEGYDIDPGMVRIVQVNMYLHQFKNPKIFQYDTLGMDERWNDKFDVILANPPFMSPKGGVRPHSKFSVQSNRSEVLFVDYIMNHLKPKGRAGIIVPEGIIFQSGSAHKQLRKNLVNDGLYAVVSLPSGVFQPYSGVKTSILLFDNEQAKQKSEILFMKVEQDGFDLGATKRPISKNDLPTALDILNKWKAGEKVESKLAIYVEKTKIAESGDYNLSGDRYRVATDYSNAKWPMVKLGEVIEFEQKSKRKSGDGKEKGLYKFFVSSQNQNKFIDEADYLNENLILGTGGAASVHIASNFSTSADTFIFHSKDIQVNNTYLYHVLLNNKEVLERGFRGQGIKHLSKEYLFKIKIPLPPLEIQEQIVAELDGYAGIIAGAKQITQNWKPKIEIDPEWEKVKLGEVIKTVIPPHKIQKSEYLVEGQYPIIDQSQDEIAGWTNDENVLVKFSKPVVIFGDHTCAIKYSRIPFAQGADGIKILLTNENLLPEFLYCYLLAFSIQSDGYKRHYGKLTESEIPLPPLAIQKQIVEKIEAERALVESAKKLVEIYEEKTKEVIAKLWEE